MATSRRPARRRWWRQACSAGIALLGAGPAPVRGRCRRACAGGRRGAARGRGAGGAGRGGRAPAGAVHGAGASRDRGGARVRISVEINGRAVRGRCRAAHAAVGLHPPRRRADRHEGGLRAGRLRRLHSPARRRAGALLPDARGRRRTGARSRRSRGSPARRAATRSSARSTRRTRSSAASARPAS